VRAVRTPDTRFADLPGYPFLPHYVRIPAGDGSGTSLRIHYVDEGGSSRPPVILLHGEPSWSYLYRHIIPILVDAGLRVIAPDLVGFGRSDKPTDPADYTYQRHVAWMRAALFDTLDLAHVTLVGQDWGGLIGLRLAAEHGKCIARIVAANTSLPTGDSDPGAAFDTWKRFSQETPEFNVGKIVQSGCLTNLPPEVIAAYDAPFPDDSFKAGARRFPMLVPTRPDDPAAHANREAWKVLEHWEAPFLTAFSDQDPITRGADRMLQSRIPGARGQPHTTIVGAGHFLQEDRGDLLARVIVDFIRATPTTAASR